MAEYLQQAIEIVKAQASIRVMNEDEIQNMLTSVANSLKNISEGNIAQSPESELNIDPKTAIREKSVICLECGKTFKVLTKRHLATHGLTPEEYKEKWGYKKSTSLVAKGLARTRRKKMQDMKLWEKRKSAAAPEKNQ